MTQPQPPQDVRIVKADGTEIPCEVRYVGPEIAADGDPVDVWELDTDAVMNVRAGDSMAIRVLPPRAGIRFPVGFGPGTIS